MDIFTLCLIAGIAGMACMGVLGIGHFGGGGHTGHVASAGGHAAGHAIGHGGSHAGAVVHAIAGGHAAGGTHGIHSAHNTNTRDALVRAPGAAGRGAARAGSGKGLAERLLSFVSPRAFFSLLLGFGLCGIVARSAGMAGSAQILVAIAGALLFELLFVLPLWNLCFRFASNPALGLESAVAEEGRAVNDFDSDGNGIVAIELNGQVVQLLGVLSHESRAEGVRFRTGDSVFIDAVDAVRGVCTVSKPGA